MPVQYPASDTDLQGPGLGCRRNVISARRAWHGVWVPLLPAVGARAPVALAASKGAPLVLKAVAVAAAWLAAAAQVCPRPACALPPPAEGEVRFEPTERERDVPARFRLEAHVFSYRQEYLPTASRSIYISRIEFPSPVETPHAANNTVHCEYFQPREPGKHPGVVVLHILGGDFELARTFSRHLAQNGAAALFLIMPYYGPRRPADAAVRMISDDPRQTVAGMTQAVLDIRRAAAWLAAREEIDPEQLGIFGISLGGITASLAAAAEPRFAKVCPMLAGGDIAQISWDHPRLSRVREKWLAEGGTKETFFKLLAEVDPVTYADRVRGRKILMLNATRDEIIPRACTEALWRALGEPELVWYDAGHISASRYLFDGMARVAKFFQPEGK